MKSFNFKKLGFRVAIITLVYLLVKLTIDHGGKDDFFNSTGIFYYFSAFFLFVLAWESNDLLVKKGQNKITNGSLDFKTNLKILAINMFIFLPIAALIYYLAIYHFDTLCEIYTENKGLQFRIDFLRAALLGFSVIIFNLFYHSLKQKKDIENQVKTLKLELSSSKYQSLKSQISPHFLFNSLNTLTSLMYEDRDLASDFVSRLASSYRYILDNREKDLVSLEKELQFLDSFIFMMKVRHDKAISIKTNINEELHRKLIPTLTLQMLVENALKHNYYSKEHPIFIIIYTENNNLVVENNIKKRTDHQDSTQLGLANIKNRYAFYTSNKVDISDDGKIFKVSMPLLANNLVEKKETSLIE